MYEINVALNGRHFFATHERSIVSLEDLKKIYPILSAKFPEVEGFNIKVCKTSTKSEYLDKDELSKII